MRLINSINSNNIVKFIRLIGIIILSVILVIIMVIFEMNTWPVGSSVSGIFLGFTLPTIAITTQDLLDTTTWKVSQRQLIRGKFIDNSTMVRISFAYLYRIKIDDKYLLIKNERGTGKYQPVGGVYKLSHDEKITLKNLYKVKDDDKISIDASSRDDYRLRMQNKHLRKFIKRFDKCIERERIDNLSREFNEELVSTGIVKWSQITYRVCGRHMTALNLGEHFQIHELLLADVVELIPTKEQLADLHALMQHPPRKIQFFTADEIVSLGVNTSAGKLKETVGDHTKKVLQETEDDLMAIPDIGKLYTVQLQ